MIVCLVTDRHRVDPVSQARLGAEAGIDLIQVRERDLDAAALATIVTSVLDAVRGTTTRVIVNDRLDVAVACGAHGVHLRSDSIPVTAARTLAPPGFLIGRSVHAAAEAAHAAEGADYLIAGTVFATSSKPDLTPLLGVEGLRAIVTTAAVPVLAIGGVTMERLDAIAAAGAAGIAGISLFTASESFARVTEAVRIRFDSVKPAS